MKWTISRKLAIGFGAILVLTTALAGGVFWQVGKSDAILDVAIPSVENAQQVQGELHHALSMHRGYMILGLQALADERLEAWEEINKNEAELVELSAYWDDEESIKSLAKLKETLKLFREQQDRIAAVAHTPQDMPATTLFFVDAEPYGDRMLESIDAVLEEERDLEATAERKLLVERLAAAKGHFLKTSAAASEYLADGTEDALSDFTSCATECQASVDRLMTMRPLLTPSQDENFQSYLDNREQFLAMTKEAVAIRGKDGWCVSEDICLNKVTPLAIEANNLAGTIATRQAEIRDASIAAFKQSRSNLLTFVGIGTALAVGVGVTVAVIVSRSIANGLSVVRTRTEEIANKNLTGAPLELSRSDEIGDVARAVDAMQVSLKNLIGTVKSAAIEVSSGATQMSATSEQIADGARDQGLQVSKIAAAVQEMAASVAEVAGKSSDGAGQADEAGERAEAGGEIVRQTIQTMNEIVEAVQASSSCVGELGRRGEEIGEIIAVINDIADQTNLLALNAAIEAARAGEHGRGFAVVADEVRKLADRTTQATADVASAIDAIQGTTVEAVERMDRGKDRVNAGVSSVTEAGMALEQIVAGSRNISAVVSSIASATDQQAATAEEVGRSVTEIADSADRTARGCEESAGAVASLSRKAEDLRRLTEQFQI